MKVWKVLGVAGLAGVAATGAIVARNERRRTQMTPEEIRERLQQRLSSADETIAASTQTQGRAQTLAHVPATETAPGRRRLLALLGRSVRR